MKGSTQYSNIAKFSALMGVFALIVAAYFFVSTPLERKSANISSTKRDKPLIESDSVDVGYRQETQLPTQLEVRDSPKIIVAKDLASMVYQELKEFRAINQKALLNTAEKETQKKQLVDQDLSRRTYLVLAEPIHNLDALVANEELRLMALDYIEKGLAWSNNPNRQYFIDSLKSIMLMDNLETIENIAIRKSFAGDKIEAYAALKQYAPEELKFINDLPEEGRIRRILRYAERLTKQ